MTVAVSLSPLAEKRLAKKAKAEGIDLPTLATRMLEAEAQRLPPDANPLPNQSTLDLLKKWDEEDQTDDPQEIARRKQELLEFMKGMNESRRFAEGPNARIPYPECE